MTNPVCNLSNISMSNDALDSSLSTIASPIPFPRVNLADIRSRMNKRENPIPINYLKEFQQDPKYKTELCKTYKETGSCAYGNKCRFAHGKHELFDKIISCKKYKQKECASFYKNKFCNYGHRCHFKHEERKLNEIERSYFTFSLMCLEKIKEEDVWTMNENEITNTIQETSPVLKQSILSRCANNKVNERNPKYVSKNRSYFFPKNLGFNLNGLHCF